jgi:hypothetical protein
MDGLMAIPSRLYRIALISATVLSLVLPGCAVSPEAQERSIALSGFTAVNYTVHTAFEQIEL